MLSTEALRLILMAFTSEKTLTPTTVAHVVVEIQDWVKGELDERAEANSTNNRVAEHVSD